MNSLSSALKRAVTAMRDLILDDSGTNIEGWQKDWPREWRRQVERELRRDPESERAQPATPRQRWDGR